MQLSEYAREILQATCNLGGTATVEDVVDVVRRLNSIQQPEPPESDPVVELERHGLVTRTADGLALTDAGRAECAPAGG